MANFVTVYDGRTRKRLAYLQNAYKISYTKSTTAVWTGSFSIPYSDPKAKYCKSFNLVEIWDTIDEKKHYAGLFRIMPKNGDTIGTDASIEIQLEHVITTLFDDTMIGFHEVGNTGVKTKDSINYILNCQSELRWMLKDCEYDHEFLYGWQNENLLSALFSITQPFEETDYYWDFDTSSFPWALSLRKTNKNPKTDIRYKKNLDGLNRSEDPTNLTTRLYCYGYGEGDNVLNISKVNNGQLYIDSPNKDRYGVITQIWTDERITNADTLLFTGQAMLKQLENPVFTYTLNIQTISTAKKLDIGDTVRVVTSEFDDLMTVKTISKDDITGAPKSGKVTLGRGTIDISNSIADLAERQRISENYSQGAESIFTDSFADNADERNPAIIPFYIPLNTEHVNEILFSCKLTAFRAYSRAVDGGGRGGLTTLSEKFDDLTSEEGLGQIPTTSTILTTIASSSAGGGAYLSIENILPDEESDVKVHNHGLTKYANIIEGIAITKDLNDFVTDVEITASQRFVPSGNHTHVIDDHEHEVEIPSHNHTVDIKAHQHKFSIPEHAHEWVLPNHAHNVDYGIYNGGTADTMTIYLDNLVLNDLIDVDKDISNLNLISYMNKESDGKISRGPHIIQVVPNKLTRVEATFQIRLFTNAKGGNQY